MSFPSDFAQHVKSVADIVRIVGESVNLRKSGSNYTGLCPFHQEKTPSFSVHATRQFYYCFGCGAKGDVFRFVMEMEKLSFPEAVRRVAQRCGIPIPEVSTREAATPQERLRAALEQLHEKAAKFYREQLMQSPEAAPVRELIKKRGVTTKSVEEFGLGFAPASGDALASFLRRDFKPEVLEASGLFVRRDSGSLLDRFRNRWIFPITAENGRTIAFAGRALGDDQPKYLNSPETTLYSKSRVLYNLSRARDAIRRANAVLLVEGYMDVIAVHQAGVENVVASCGTSLTEPQVRILLRHSPEVIVSYDPDSAGVAATDRSFGLLLAEGMRVRVLRLPGGLDPDQYVQQAGAEAYQARVQEAQPLFRYLALRALEIHGKTSPENKLQAMNFVLPFVAMVPNKLMRAELAADIAQRMDLSPGLVWEAFQKAAAERRDRMEPPSGSGRLASAEAMLIRLLLDQEETRESVARSLKERGLLAEFESQAILSAVLDMAAEGTVPDVTSLAERLDATQQRLLAEVLFDKDARPVSFDEVNSYMLVLERKALQKQRRSLQQEIQKAQQAQNSELFLELLRQQNELDKRWRSVAQG